MTIEIRIEPPLSEDSRSLIAASEAHLRLFYSTDECSSRSAPELASPDTQFFVARQNRRAIGCVALVHQGGYGEVKRLFVSPDARGTGAARALMAKLEQAAGAAGLPVVKLETGRALADAVALYRKLGYVDCPAFGCYVEMPSKVFLEKAVDINLTPRPRR